MHFSDSRQRLCFKFFRRGRFRFRHGGFQAAEGVFSLRPVIGQQADRNDGQRGGDAEQKPYGQGFLENIHIHDSISFLSIFLVHASSVSVSG